MNSNAYTLYMTRSSTFQGLTVSQQFPTLESAYTFARAHAIKWVIRCQGDVVIQGQNA